MLSGGRVPSCSLLKFCYLITFINRLKNAKCTEWAKPCPDVTVNLCYSLIDAVQLMEPSWHALEGQTRTRIRDRSQNLGRFSVEFSDAPESLLSTAKSSVCMYLHTHACVLLPMMEDLALHGKVRNMTSFPFFSTRNIFIFFCISSRFPWFVKPTGQDPELLRTAKPTALGRMAWIAATSHPIELSPRYLNLQLRTGLAVLLLFLFTSLFFKLYQSTWGFTLFHRHPAPSSAKGGVQACKLCKH